MVRIRELQTPVGKEQLATLASGDLVNLSGVLYTARDAAHQRLVARLEAGEPLPFALENQALFYVGPSPTPPGKIIGSCGPTTSSRMDPYTPLLLEQGLKIMIGKGPRSQEVVQAIQRHQAAYLVATGGAAALLAQCVKKAELIAYPDLGPEAIYRLEVEKMPLIVAIDPDGRNLFARGAKEGAPLEQEGME
ncbi:MAG TPA: TRZ/ATZ family protein [Hydrogenispora sp.]|jgi:fumarate hydratase subunit beta|nr:TRZ/ATZ family protein [Hydrogenispora sp.]